MILYTCERCTKTFTKKCDIFRHIEMRKKPCGVKNIIINPDKLFVENMNENMNENIKEKKKIKCIQCAHCEKSFTRNSSLRRHYNSCKIKKDLTKDLIIDNEKLKNENDKLKKQNTEKIENNNENYVVNIRLIDIITDKNKTIEELKTSKNIDNIVIIKKKEKQDLILNDIIISSCYEDNYVNATQLCQAGNKKFSHWISLDSTKELINVLESDAGIPAEVGQEAMRKESRVATIRIPG